MLVSKLHSKTLPHLGLSCMQDLRNLYANIEQSYRELQIYYEIDLYFSVVVKKKLKIFYPNTYLENFEMRTKNMSNQVYE